MEEFKEIAGPMTLNAPRAKEPSNSRFRNFSTRLQTESDGSPANRAQADTNSGLF